MKHGFSVGAEFSHEKADRSSYVVDTTSGLPTGTPRSCTGLVGAASNYNCTSLANPNPNDPWSGSIARGPYGTETRSRTRAIYLFDTLELHPQWLVNAGLRYDHFETDLTTTTATATTRSDMEPEETRNYEIGTKWNLLDDALSLTAAVFRTEKGNARVLVADSTYENAGKTRVDGVELSATGKLTDKWQLFAGYSYLDSELVDGGALGNRSGDRKSVG